jgi:hypothetical protein
VHHEALTDGISLHRDECGDLGGFVRRRSLAVSGAAAEAYRNVAVPVSLARIRRAGRAFHYGFLHHRPHVVVTGETGGEIAVTVAACFSV